MPQFRGRFAAAAAAGLAAFAARAAAGAAEQVGACPAAPGQRRCGGAAAEVEEDPPHGGASLLQRMASGRSAAKVGSGADAPQAHAAAGQAAGQAEWWWQCPRVHTQPGFNLTAYMGTWYAQQQMPTAYLPESANNCVSATYRLLTRPTFPWRYTVGIRNLAVEDDGRVRDSGDLLAAYQRCPLDAAKLAVAPKFLPRFLAGDYWVLAFNEAKGYALVSGGQPTIKTPDGCKTGGGVNQAGLWIFTRQQHRNEAIVLEVRAIAKEQGFDLSVLNNVDQTNCKAIPPTQ